MQFTLAERVAADRKVKVMILRHLDNQNRLPLPRTSDGEGRLLPSSGLIQSYQYSAEPSLFLHALDPQSALLQDVRAPLRGSRLSMVDFGLSRPLSSCIIGEVSRKGHELNMAEDEGQAQYAVSICSNHRMQVDGSITYIKPVSVRLLSTKEGLLSKGRILSFLPSIYC